MAATNSVAAARVALVRRSTSLCTALPGLAGRLSLRLITPAVPELYYIQDESKLPFPEPWWAFCWPGGWGLTQYILDHPSVIRGQRVLDLGSGCGSAALAALRGEAESVCANDIDPWAAVALEVNAEVNGLQCERLSASTCDLLAQPAANVADVVLVGDMLFDEQLGARVWSYCTQCAALGARVFVGDPGRHVLSELPNSELLEVGAYELNDEEEDAASLIFQSGLTRAVVYEVTGRQDFR